MTNMMLILEVFIPSIPVEYARVEILLVVRLSLTSEIEVKLLHLFRPK